MIEFCTKKRMALAIVMLIIISVAVLVIENNVSFGHDMKEISKKPVNKTDECWEHYPNHVSIKCSPCTRFEMRAMKDTCAETGYREYVECQLPEGITKGVYKSCPRESWREERLFWVFESGVGLIGLMAYGLVHMRQKRLDRLLLEKVCKQIASGV